MFNVLALHKIYLLNQRNTLQEHGDRSCLFDSHEMHPKQFSSF